MKDFVQMNMFIWTCTNHKCFCLDMHSFYSFDNWLCDLISANWQLTLISVISDFYNNILLNDEGLSLHSCTMYVPNYVGTCICNIILCS